jgi:hypothetical protein
MVKPELAKMIRDASIEAKSKVLQEQDRMTKLEQMKADYVTDMTDTIKELGIDPNDSRIDWADDAPTPLKRTKQIMSSVSKILKETKSPEKVDKKEVEKITKEAEQKLRKEYDIDAIDKTTSSPATSDGDFVRKFASGELPMTKANVDKYNKIKSNYD